MLASILSFSIVRNLHQYFAGWNFTRQVHGSTCNSLAFLFSPSGWLRNSSAESHPMRSLTFIVSEWFYGSLLPCSNLGVDLVLPRYHDRVHLALILFFWLNSSFPWKNNLIFIFIIFLFAHWFMGCQFSGSWSCRFPKPKASHSTEYVPGVGFSYGILLGRVSVQKLFKPI